MMPIQKNKPFNAILCILWLIVWCLPYYAHAQPKPGSETIVISLPDEYRWKSNKIPKDTKGIRSTEYVVSGKNMESAPVRMVNITTIDKRYYPIKAVTAPTEKLNYLKAYCPEATLDIIEQQTTGDRTAVLYTIKSGTSHDCGATIFLGYAAEGPTALHTIELQVATVLNSPELFKRWCDLLLDNEIK